MEYMRTIPDGYFDLAVVDPPYGGANSAVGGGRRFGGWFDRYKTCDENRRHMGGQIRKKIIGWDEAPSPEYFAELFRVSKHQIIWGANYFSLPPDTVLYCMAQAVNIGKIQYGYGRICVDFICHKR